jgi:DNA-binding transcriptional LysR family regulator
MTHSLLFNQTKIFEYNFRKIEMAIKLDMLRIFIVVARVGRLADAADIMGRTPSALSMSLKQLEDHLGEPLFETDRKNRLTALGEFVLRQADQEVQQFDKMISEIEGFARAKRGKVRIAAVPSVAATIMPIVMARHLKECPDVAIDLRDMESRSVDTERLHDRVGF